MRRIVMLPAALSTFALAGTALAASPETDAGAGIDAPVVNSTWMNVCREKSALRRDARGRLVVVQVPRCNMVWVGKRYFFNGNYYADPNFVLPL